MINALLMHVEKYFYKSSTRIEKWIGEIIFLQ